MVVNGIARHADRVATSHCTGIQSRGNIDTPVRDVWVGNQVGADSSVVVNIVDEAIGGIIPSKECELVEEVRTRVCVCQRV